MNYKTIAMIGAGNMGRALIGGLIADGYPAERLLVSDPERTQLTRIESQFAVRTSTDNRETATLADVIVLAVKPQQIKAVATGIAHAVKADALVLSIAAGITTRALAAWLGAETAVVRVMPNTPALVGSGAAALYAAERVSAEQRDAAEFIMRAVGVTVWLEDEGQMDAVTAVAGSGPAYFFLIMEIMEKAAIDLGLPPPQARLLVLETAFGAAKLALNSDTGPADLRAQVTSPGGTTEQALQVFMTSGLDRIFLDAMTAAKKTSAALAQKYGDY